MKVSRRKDGFGERSTAKVRGGFPPGWVLLLLLLTGVLAPLAAQQGRGASSLSREFKVRGVIMERLSEGFTLKEYRGIELTIELSSSTQIHEEKKNFLRDAIVYSVSDLVAGLEVKVEGTQTSSRILAEKVEFTQDALKIARTITSQVEPLKAELAEANTRLEENEQRDQVHAGEMEELEAAARQTLSEVKRVEGTAETALIGVEATNRRFSRLDQYQTGDLLTVQSLVNSAEVSEEAKAQLDVLAETITTTKGYLVEIRGFASSDGVALSNLELSQRRADQVRRYLVEQHQIPMRRFVAPFGYGVEQPVGDNTTPEGRESNRRVEVRVLVSPELNE